MTFYILDGLVFDELVIRFVTEQYLHHTSPCTCTKRLPHMTQYLKLADWYNDNILHIHTASAIEALTSYIGQVH